MQLATAKRPRALVERLGQRHILTSSVAKKFSATALCQHTHVLPLDRRTLMAAQ